VGRHERFPDLSEFSRLTGPKSTVTSPGGRFADMTDSADLSDLTQQIRMDTGSRSSRAAAISVVAEGVMGGSGEILGEKREACRSDGACRGSQLRGGQFNRLQPARGPGCRCGNIARLSGQG